MNKIKQGLIAISLAALCSSAVFASDGKCSMDFGKISVTGQGEVRVMPDRASLNYRVVSNKPTPAEAREEVEKTVTAFAKAVEALKLDKNAFVADSIVVIAQYRYNEKDKKQELVGYEGSRNVTIKVSDFALIGQLNDAAIKSGINQISGFEYTLSDKKKYEKEAAKLAIADAKDRAQLLADGFEVKLGTPCSLSFQESNYGVYRAYSNRSMLLAANAEADPVESTYSIEPIVVSSSVEAIYSIKNEKKDKKDKKD